MRKLLPTNVTRPPLFPGAGRATALASGSHGFSLVELLVVISIMLVLMGLTGAAVSGARSSQNKQATQALIAKLDAVITEQFARYATRSVADATTAIDRGNKLRMEISGDLPDRWVDVSALTATTESPHQRAYAAAYKSLVDAGKRPTNQYAGAECLFMIIMRGSIANCLDCSDLSSEKIGDKDKDGAFEFWDAWGNPIGFILWPAALELPAGSGQKFFSTSTPFAPGGTGRTMRPLIYSAGPDGTDQGSSGDFGFLCNAGNGNRAAGPNCGNPVASPASQFAKPAADGSADDNLTNLDAEAKL
jgi:prepilin-type N-terminal cleavage/methylation domain-containing protein